MLPSLSLTSGLTRCIWITLGALLVYRLGVHLPLPGVDADTFARLLATGPRTGLAHLVSGSANTERLSILALGVMPYVGSCLVVHVIATFYAPLRALRRQGPEGWARFNQVIRVGAAILAAIQGYGVAVALENVPNLVPLPGPLFVPTVVASLVAGTMLLIWLGEQIFRRGLTDGVWLLFVAGSIAGAPREIAALVDVARTGAASPWIIAVCGALFAGLVALIVFVERAERPLPAPARGASAPALRLNVTGILGPLAAGSALPLVAFGAQSAGGMLGWGNGLMEAMLPPRGPLYFPVYALLIVLLVFYFARLVAGASEDAEQRSIQMRLTLIGAVYLAALSIAPQLAFNLTGFPFFLGGMALMVIVLVALNALDRIEELVPGALNRTAETT